MTFTNPSYLWALSGLAIPLAIHLLSRKEGKVIRVGSLRHVEESNTSQFKSIKLNEILLLLLRMLMIALLALFMSGAQCSGPDSKNVKWVVAEQGIDVDSLVTKGYELHPMPKQNYWAYVEELNKLPYDIVVVSYSRAENFKGKRIALNSNIKWITAESKPDEFQALAWRVGETVFVRTAKSDARITTFSTGIKVPDSIKVIEPKPVSINTTDKIVLAALNVIKKQYRLPISTSEQGIKIVQDLSLAGPLVQRVSDNEIKINKALDQDVAIHENLVIGLFRVLFPELEKPVANNDTRVMPDQLAWSAFVPSSFQPLARSAGIENWLILLFLLTLTVERFVAIRRNQ